MNKLTKQELMNIYSVGKNLTDKPIFIDFYADWWGPCRMFNSVLDDITPRYEGKINMYKVTEKNKRFRFKFRFSISCRWYCRLRKAWSKQTKINAI